MDIFDTLRVSNEMQEIYADSNPTLLISSWNFQGMPMQRNIRFVVTISITLLINTEITHKKRALVKLVRA